MTASPENFNPVGTLPAGRLALEASAGTGKTWTIAALTSRFVAEGIAPLDQILIVTFTRAATAELRDRVRRRLVDTRRHLARTLGGTAGPPADPVLALLATGDPDVLTERIARLDVALRDFDAAAITTIHGFCQRVLAAAGYAGEIDGHARLVEDLGDLTSHAVHDMLVTRFHDVPADLHGADRPKPGPTIELVRQLLATPDVAIRPDPDALDAAAPDPGGDPDADAPTHPPKGVHLATVGRAAAEQVTEEKRRRGTMTFDDLLVRLERSLRDDAAAEAITGAMQRAFSLALIDEFQDTDPTQWAILRRLFGDGRLVLIGDPKQAIYSFRGADVHAYLDATGSDAETATLGSNWRTDRRLLDVLGTLFDGTRFGDDRIAHRPVVAHHQQDRLAFPDGPRAPFQVRALAETGLLAGPSRDRVAADVVAQVAALLSANATITDDDGTQRPLAPGDCAILVRTNDHATGMKDALVGAGIPAVVNGVGSVLRAPAKDDWDLLLHALEQPSSPARVRALSLTWLVGHTAAELDAMDDVADAALHEQAHRWARLLAEKGVASLVRAVARDTRLHERVLGLVGGDRWLADVEHIAELLHTASAGESISPGGLRTWMAEQADGSDELPSEQLARRLESDARAVQILTIHRAKGLEFGVVLCPDLVAAAWQVSVPVHVRDPQTGAAYIDAGSADEDVAKERKKVADAGEQLRSLYVALTRARHRLIVWWWPFEWNSAMQTSPLSKVLFCDGDGPARVTAEQPAPLTKGDGEGVRVALHRAGERLGSDAEVVILPLEAEEGDRGAVAPLRESGEGDGPLATGGTDRDGEEETGSAALERRRFRGDVDWLWTRASFSALTSPRPHARVPITPDTVPVVTDEEEGKRQDDLMLPSAADLAGHIPLPLHAQPAGAAFGTMVHAVLEHAELDAGDLGLELATTVTAQMAATGTTVPDPDDLAAGLLAVCRTPMGPAFDDATLDGIARHDRLDELEFELPVSHHGAHVTLEALASLLADHLGPDDPLSGYPAMLADRSLRQGFRGYLAGFVDLVWRRHTPDGPVFHVIDHKSNRLYGWEEALAQQGGSTWHYRAEAMTRAMQHSHYVLQGLVYRVALHRYLRWRQPGYDPVRHLGAIGYTFLRGMAGPDTPLDSSSGGHPAMRCGVFAWLPPAGLTEAMSDLMEEGT